MKQSRTVKTNHRRSEKQKALTFPSGLCNLAVREGFEPSIRCRIHTFQACSFSHSDTSPNFGLLFNVFSQHRVRCAVALERGVMYGIRVHVVNAIFYFLRSFAQYPNQLTKNMPFRIPFIQFTAASCKCSPLSASSSEP